MARTRSAATRGALEAVDIVIITILQEEYEAVRQRLKNVRRDPGTEEQPNLYAWMRGEIERVEGGSYRVVLAMAGSPGTTSGSLATSRTIARWRPRYVLLVGIAGGMKREGLSLGDVVVSSLIRAYEYGKIQEGRFEPRPDFQYPVDGSLHRTALSLKVAPWQKGLGRRPAGATGRSKVLAGPIASGDKVVDDVSSDFFAAVAKSFPKLLAVEMEGAGAAAAIDAAQEEGRSVGFLMIRGISDMPPAASSRQQASGRNKLKKSSGGTEVRDSWKVYAANAAAHFAVYVVARGWPVPPLSGVDAQDWESVSKRDREEARARYFHYLETECGEIQLDGLPADEELGSRRLELEKLFVPLHVVRCQPAEVGNGAQSSSPMGVDRGIRGDSSELQEDERLFFGKVLTSTARVALLAPPGGGKSTMLKRLALAYAFPERRRQLDDRLPERRWLPLLLRCRDLKLRATEPFREILAVPAERAEMKEQQDAFRALVDEAIADQSLLLLVDGLDEISDEGARGAFVHQLYTFLELYPGVGMIVTSREAGFRLVATTVAKLCTCYRLAEFSDEDITRLTVAWHREVIGNKPQVIKDAENLAASIHETDRVRRLARNPLLLTTLLLVKRWVGELPQRRGVLYQKAIEVLLMSWNTTAHEKLEAGEALPQLGFLAFMMMKEGIQQISERRLRAILVKARGQMEDIYAYTRISVDEFIRRVEHRSSLLVQSGHIVEEGRLWSLYEFRHLTFQEYLAAHAVAEGHYPGRKERDTVLSALQPYLDTPSWREVIPLAAALAGRNVKLLVEHLTERCERECRSSAFRRLKTKQGALYKHANPARLLVQCLVDEVPLLPALAERAILALGRADNGLRGTLEPIMRGRYREILERVVKDDLVANAGDFRALGSALGDIGYARVRAAAAQDGGRTAVEQLRRHLRSGNPMEQATAALTLITWVFYKDYHSIHLPQEGGFPIKSEPVELEPLLQAPQYFVRASAAWAYAWLAESGMISIESAKRVFPRLFEMWRREHQEALRDFAAWTIGALPLFERTDAPLAPPTQKQLKWLCEEEARRDPRAVWVVAYYWRKPWSDHALRKRIERSSAYYKHLGKTLLDVLVSEGHEAQARRAHTPLVRSRRARLAE